MLLMILQYTSQPATTKNYLAQDINSAKAEKSGSNTKAAPFPIPTPFLEKFQKFSLFLVPDAASKDALTFVSKNPFPGPWLSCLPLPTQSSK